MGNYAERATKAPRTLTIVEQQALLKLTGATSETFRDHVILSVALGTALRESEILALNCGDIYDAQDKARRRVALRVFKRSGRSTDSVPQEVYLPDALRRKLDKFRRWKQQRGEDIGEAAPLFLAQNSKRRLGGRRLRRLFREWQTEADFAKPFSFHALRHTCLTNLLRNSGGDLRLVQRVARHASILTTMIYTMPSDEEVASSVKKLDC